MWKSTEQNMGTGVVCCGLQYRTSGVWGKYARIDFDRLLKMVQDCLLEHRERVRAFEMQSNQ